MPCRPGIERRKYDPDRARHHLKRAGLDSLEVELSAADSVMPGAVDMVVLYAEQAKKAGIEIVPVREPNDRYWANVWLKKPFVFVKWGTRPTPDNMFTLDYTGDAPWNEGHWLNERFNELLLLAKGEPDEVLRAEMYREMCQIARDDGGTIIPLIVNFVYARCIKTPEECKAQARSAFVCETALRKMREQAAPGVSENELWSTRVAVNSRFGGDYVETRLVVSGANTNPWYTEAGELVYQHSRSTLEDLVRMRSALDARRGRLSGTVRVLAVDSLMVHFLPESIASFHSEHPLVKVRAHSADPGAMVSAVSQRGEADIGLGFHDPARAGVDVVERARCPLCVLMRNPLAQPSAGQRRQPLLRGAVQYPEVPPRLPRAVR